MRYLAFIAVFLFCAGYLICEVVFPNNLAAWWDLRMLIYTIIISLCFRIGYLITRGFTQAVFLVGLVFCGGDILDRYIFDINRFDWNDILLFLFALIYLPRAYARETKTNP